MNPCTNQYRVLRRGLTNFKWFAHRKSLETTGLILPMFFSLANSGTEKPRPMSDNDNFLGLANNKVINIFFRKVLKKLKKVDKYTRDCTLVLISTVKLGYNEQILK